MAGSVREGISEGTQRERRGGESKSRLIIREEPEVMSVRIDCVSTGVAESRVPVVQTFYRLRRIGA